MRDLKLLFLATMALTFLAGAGAGAWLGTLRAAAAPATIPPIEMRMRDWNEAYTLDRSQNRRLRAILLHYDEMSERIRDDLDAERFRQIQDLRRECREQVREVLNEKQRAEYDRRVEGR